MRLFTKSEKSITVSTETILRAILLTIAILLALKFAGSISHELRLIAVAGFLALALNPAVNWIMKHLKSKSRTRATGMAYLLVLTLLIAFLMLVVPPLVRQSSEFIRDIPATVDNFRTEDSAAARLARRYGIDSALNNISNDFSSRIGEFTGPVFSTASRIGGTIISIIIVLVLTFMMLVEGPVWHRRMMAMQPPGKRAHREMLLKRMYHVVTGYVNGQVLIAAIAAGFALITLLIASTLTDSAVNAVALAGIVFIFGLIPLIGNILAAVVVVLFSLFESSTLAIIMGVYFILYQQIENATLQPYIQSRANQLTPLTVFIAALLGAGLGGLLGALVAIPIVGCLRVILEDRWKRQLPSMQTVHQDSKPKGDTK